MSVGKKDIVRTLKDIIHEAKDIQKELKYKKLRPYDRERTYEKIVAIYRRLSSINYELDEL